MSDSQDKTRPLSSPAVALVDPVSGKRLPIWDGITVGRTEGDQTFPEDAMMSRSHLLISKTNSDYFVEDQGSTNGTRLNGELLKPMTRVRLAENDLLEFGVQAFRFSESTPTIKTHLVQSRGYVWLGGYLLVVFAWLLGKIDFDFLGPGTGSTTISWASQALPACLGSFYPFDPEQLRQIAFVTSALSLGAGLKVHFFFRSTSNPYIARYPRLAQLAAYSALLVLLYNPVDDWFAPRLKADKRIAHCACPANLNSLNPRFKSCRDFSQSPEFAKIPDPAKQAITSNLSAHPFSRLSSEQLKTFDEAYKSIQHYILAKDFERAEEKLRIVLELVPGGAMNSPLYEKAIREKNPNLLQQSD